MWLRKDDGKARLTVPVLRPKKCKACGEKFTPARQMQTACGIACSMTIAATKRDKQEKKADAEKREKLKSRRQWLNEAQAAFNAWIRARDAKLACVSCGRHHDGQWHAGHFLSTGARPELRFDPANVHKQCAPCNTHLSGNLVLYRAELVRRIGQAEVDRLEGPAAPLKYAAEELRVIRDTYRAKGRQLAKEKEHE